MNTVQELKKLVRDQINYKSCSFKAIHEAAQMNLRENLLGRAAAFGHEEPFSNFEMELIKLIDKLED